MTNSADDVEKHGKDGVDSTTTQLKTVYDVRCPLKNEPLPSADLLFSPIGALPCPAPAPVDLELRLRAAKPS